MRKPLMLLTAALLIPLGAAGASEAADPSHKLAEIVLPADALPEGCALIDGERAISMQASTLYTMDLGKIAGGPPVAKQFQSMRCHKDEGTVFYYEYASEADTDLAFGFIRPLI